jgi:hypothetical protein
MMIAKSGNSLNQSPVVRVQEANRIGPELNAGAPLDCRKGIPLLALIFRHMLWPGRIVGHVAGRVTTKGVDVHPLYVVMASDPITIAGKTKLRSTRVPATATPGVPSESTVHSSTDHQKEG